MKQILINAISEAVQSPYGTVPQSYKHRLLAQKPIVTPGGSVRIADTSNFPVAKTTAAALVEIKPGGNEGNSLAS